MKLHGYKELQKWLRVSRLTLTRHFTKNKNKFCAGEWADMPRTKIILSVPFKTYHKDKRTTSYFRVNEYDTDEVLAYLTKKFNQDA